MQKNISLDDLEKIGEISDSIENLLCAMELPLPSNLHIESLKNSLPDKVKELRDIYINISGENPWE